MYTFSNAQAPQAGRGGSIRFLLIVVVVAVVIFAGVGFWRAGTGSGSGNVMSTEPSYVDHALNLRSAAQETAPDDWEVLAAFDSGLIRVRDGDGDTWECQNAIDADACEITPSDGNAIFEPLGWPTRAGALANCKTGQVGEVWRKGSVAGWACELQPIVE